MRTGRQRPQLMLVATQEELPGEILGCCPPSPAPNSPGSAPLALLGRVPGPHGLHEQAQTEQGTAEVGVTRPNSAPHLYLTPHHGLRSPPPQTPVWGCPQEYLEFRKERSRMLLSRRNQLLLEFSFWNEPLPRQGPNIYELRTYKLKVSGRGGPDHTLGYPLGQYTPGLGVLSVMFGGSPPNSFFLGEGIPSRREQLGSACSLFFFFSSVSSQGP